MIRTILALPLLATGDLLAVGSDIVSAIGFKVAGVNPPSRRTS